MNAPILTTQGLGLDIGGATIVAGVSLEVAAGEFLGIIGPNGAGKTSLFNLLSGLLRPTSGTVTLGGRDVTHATPDVRAQAGLGRTFQLSSVFPRLSAFENVRLAAEASLGGTFRVWRRASRVREAVERAHTSLERVRLGGHERISAASLSGGDKRKLEVAMLLASDPTVFLFDEPMAGVSAEDVPELVDVIGAVHHGGKTVLMVEHHIEVVTGLAQRIAVMHHGSVLACDTPENVMRDATVQRAYVGEKL
jgi:branched-chain amino acid transport system ATP-binding protein